MNFISPEQMSVIKGELRDSFRHLIFRRTSDVFVKDLENTYYIEPLEEFPWEKSTNVPDHDVSKVSFEMRRKRVQREYGWYMGYTSRKVLRGNDQYEGTRIEFQNKNFSEFNLLTLKFEERSYKNRVPPYPPAQKKSLRIEGDLICGLVVPGRNGPEYSKWFICSEQFFRLWTLIMYEDHETFQKVYGKDMKKKITSGNRLNTNSYVKWLLSCRQNGKDVEKEESDSRFYALRTETVSKYSVHTYTAIALLVMYGELPSPDNVPNNNDGCPKMKSWCIMPGIIESLLRMASEKNSVQSEGTNIPLGSIKEFPPLPSGDAQVKGTYRETVIHGKSAPIKIRQRKARREAEPARKDQREAEPARKARREAEPARKARREAEPARKDQREAVCVFKWSDVLEDECLDYSQLDSLCKMLSVN